MLWNDVRVQILGHAVVERPNSEQSQFLMDSETCFLTRILLCIPDIREIEQHIVNALDEVLRGGKSLNLDHLPTSS